MRSLFFLALLLAAAPVSAGDELPVALPGTGIPDALFQLHEMDLHYHSVLERPATMPEWIDMAVAGGRKVLVLMDHLELYRKTPEQWRNPRIRRWKLGVRPQPWG